MSIFAKPSLFAFVAAVLLSSSCVVETGEKGKAMVRYTWDVNQRFYIQEIIAGYEDVRYWKNYVYNAGGYVEEDVTDDPRHDGSYDIHDKIYSVNVPQDAKRYNGVYLPVSPGNYTAVCAVSGLNLNSTSYIVANYRIDAGVNEAVNYYEVAFDVGAFLAGESDSGWVFISHGSDSGVRPLFKGAPVGGLVSQ